MAHATQRLLGAQRNLFETSQNIGLKGLEGTTRLVHLHLQALDNLLGTATNRIQDATLPETGSDLSPAGLAPMPDDGKTFASYARQVAEIVSTTNGELARLLQQQTLGWHSLGRAMLHATMTPATEVCTMLQALMRNPVGALRWSFGPPPDNASPGAADMVPGLELTASRA